MGNFELIVVEILY